LGFDGYVVQGARRYAPAERAIAELIPGILSACAISPDPGHQTIAHPSRIIGITRKITLQHAVFDDRAPDEQDQRNWGDEGRNPRSERNATSGSSNESRCRRNQRCATLCSTSFTGCSVQASVT